MLQINNKQELIDASNKLKELCVFDIEGNPDARQKLDEILAGSALPQIVFNIDAFDPTKESLFIEYFTCFVDITNNKFSIKLVLLSDINSYDNKSKLLYTVISKLIDLNIQDKITCLSFKKLNVAAIKFVFENSLLDELIHLRDIEFDALWSECLHGVFSGPFASLDQLNEFCQKHQHIESCTITNIEKGTYMRQCIEIPSWQEGYKKLQNIVQQNTATLSKLADCIEKINDLEKTINYYAAELRNTTIPSKVRNSHMECYNNACLQIEKQRQKFKEYSESLKIKQNPYVYYYLAKYQFECENSENINYKLILECLEKIIPPVDSDPNYEKHREIYDATREWKIALCLDEEAYAKIKDIDLLACAKNNSGEYILPEEATAERMQLITKYALESKGMSITAINALQEYVFDEFLDANSTNKEFACIDPKKENFEIIFGLLQSYKKHVSEHKKEKIDKEVQTEFQGEELAATLNLAISHSLS